MDAKIDCEASGDPTVFSRTRPYSDQAIICRHSKYVTDYLGSAVATIIFFDVVLTDVAQLVGVFDDLTRTSGWNSLRSSDIPSSWSIDWNSSTFGFRLRVVFRKCVNTSSPVTDR